jgi:hypothetical protein
MRDALAAALLLVATVAACTHTVKVEPIKVEPIDITLHVYLEADEKLDEFFGDIEAPPSPPKAKPADPAQPEGAKR